MSKMCNIVTFRASDAALYLVIVLNPNKAQTVLLPSDGRLCRLSCYFFKRSPFVSLSLPKAKINKVARSAIFCR